MDIQVIYLDIQVNSDITLLRSNLDGSPIPPAPPPADNFFTLHHTIFFLNIKDVEFYFRMGCILVLFPFLWIINMQFMNFLFLFLKISDIGLLWSKITIFIIEITIKLLLPTKYGWNNPNWCRLILKNPKLHFFAISGRSKFISYTNIQIHVTRSIFIVFFFLMLVPCPLSESLTIEISKIC